VIHRVFDVAECRTATLGIDEVLALMRQCAEGLGCTVRAELGEQFQPQGVTCVLVLAESHLVVTTWPEHRFATIDLYTCQADVEPTVAVRPLLDALGGRVALDVRIPRMDPRSATAGRWPAPLAG
jgi:S-adenosylmethionine decarboxylase